MPSGKGKVLDALLCLPECIQHSERLHDVGIFGSQLLRFEQLCSAVVIVAGAAINQTEIFVQCG